jgi:DNA primase
MGSKGFAVCGVQRQSPWPSFLMALPPAFLDELRARTPMQAVIGRQVRLTRSGKNWKGCCPFHGEKSPSFYVYDDHFHCFGCGAHGDAISFVMQSQGRGFPEAVEQLAAEAGMEVPKATPEAVEAERHRHDLHSVLEAAASAYQRRLRLPEGRAALDYFHRRGLTDATIETFGLGWTGEGRGVLASELGRDGITPDQLLEAGLLRPSDHGGAPYDLFFNRVMFPIRDRRGRVISFGGRTLGDGQPKYVNGPETALFSKRRSLYALDLAREGVRSGQALVVVEGYMDVIALHQAGFTGAVAPLGTALTDEQFSELWRLSPEPVLCFDGDGAGGRAAARAAETCLPLLAPDRTLRVATLPAGEDPDTLLARHGNAAFDAILAAARPLSAVLFDILRAGSNPDATPEQRAAFRARLEDAAKRIPDKSLAGEYRATLLDRFFAERTTRRRPAQAGRPTKSFAPAPRAIARHPFTALAAGAERERILTAILLRHPDLLRDVDHAYAELPLPDPLARLRATLLDWAETTDALDFAGLIDHLHSSGLAVEAAQALSAVPVPLPACAAADAMPAEAEAGWWHIFGLMHRERLDEEVAAAQRDFAGQADETAQRRLIALCAARDALRRGDHWGEQGEAEA